MQVVVYVLFIALSWCTCSGFSTPSGLSRKRGRPISFSALSTGTEDTKRRNSAPHVKTKIVLVAGFESFNRDLYYQSVRGLDIDLAVFADSDIRVAKSSDAVSGINPAFEKAVEEADAFVCSLMFDYDDVIAIKGLLSRVSGPILIFESATELMEFNHVGSFSMAGGASGPPPAVKAIISLFGSKKEEDKLSGYLKFLKIGPALLKFVPGSRAADLRVWLEAYRYWNQGGASNFRAMMQLLVTECDSCLVVDFSALPAVQVTPDVGLIHPVRYHEADNAPNIDRYFVSPRSYLDWRFSHAAVKVASDQGFVLAPDNGPRVAILLYRKHVITEQRYLLDIIRQMEEGGIVPVPIFINGVEAHTIVRDLLTSKCEEEKVKSGESVREGTYRSDEAVAVDAIVNTIGFPLVGGPAGSMQAGRNVAVAEALLNSMDVPYFVASPLLLQSIPQWKQDGVTGLQSVVVYSLPELDGAIDSIVLGGLVGDKIAVVPERVRKMNSRVLKWIALRKKRKSDRKLGICLYGFPPNVGAVGTAALLDVPRSLDNLLRKLAEEGYDVGQWASDENANGESIVAALATICEDSVIMRGIAFVQEAVDDKIARAVAKDETAPATLALPGGGLGGARVVAREITAAELESMLGKYMMKKVRRNWSEDDRGPGVAANGSYVVAGLEIGNIFVFVQPLLGVEGDPMRLLFERDLTPHPQYCAMYKWLGQSIDHGGLGVDALVHFGMHGTVEWLPGQPLGNDRSSWSDELLSDLPNLYVYAANNPSESILAKRRGYGTIVSYNVPPYRRSGLYLELASLKDLIEEYRTGDEELFISIVNLAKRGGMLNDVPFSASQDEVEDPSQIAGDDREDWIGRLSEYLSILQNRLFSSGLHVLGENPTEEDLMSYLDAYFGEKLQKEERAELLVSWRGSVDKGSDANAGGPVVDGDTTVEALEIMSLLNRTTEEMSSLLNGLNGGYIAPSPGGDLIRDGRSVLPTGRNIHSLDPYRMPSAGAWARGRRVAEAIIEQHRRANDGAYPETVAVTMWGLDAIKTRGESVAIALALVGATPVREGTGRVVRFDLIPLDELQRPRIDVLASLSGIFRDSFRNIVDLLDDMFERAANVDESPEDNFVRKHVQELIESGVTERPAARLFSNPPGDYGSMVNEVVGNGEWDDDKSLGETWKNRNAFSYGRNEARIGEGGTARPEVLDKLLETTERVVQEVDSVEYGLTDIQEYYANTGALKKAAENRKIASNSNFKRCEVAVSIVEAFGPPDEGEVVVKEIEEVLRLEYRTKLLNPKWRDRMLNQGSGGAYEISQRMTAMIGWAATARVDNFVFDQAAQRYALDEDVAKKLQQSNPEAFKNVVRRLLEAAGRSMWSTDDDTLRKLNELYADADDIVERGNSMTKRSRK